MKDDLRERAVQLDGRVTVANAAQGLVVHHHGEIRVLQQGVHDAEIHVALRDAWNCPGIPDVETRDTKKSNYEAVALTLVGMSHVGFVGSN